MRKYFDKIRTFAKKNKTLLIVVFVLKTIIKIGILLVIFLRPKDSAAQSTNSLIRSGNKSYDQQKYNQATDKYTAALSKEPNNEKAIFNQANAMYQLGEYEKAASYFDAISKQTKNLDVKSKAYHNLGNTFYKQSQFEKSVQAYKEALKINPSDKDTKYNLMMAMAKLKDDQQQQQKQDQKNKQENKQNQQQNQQSAQDKNKAQQQKEQEQQGKMSNEEAQRLLEALENEEGKTQQKLQQQQGNGKKTKVAKDW